MNNYLIELAAVHLTLTAAYWLFLRKERQYSLMRFYIIGAVILSLAVPLFKLPALFKSENVINVAPAEVTTFNPVAAGPIDDPYLLSTDLLVYFYIGVTLFFFYKFVDSIFRVVYLHHKCSS